MKFRERLVRALGYAPTAPKRRAGTLPRGRIRLSGQGMGFDAAQISTLYEGLARQSVPINQEIHQQLTALRARSRQLAKNDPYIRRYSALNRTNVVGPDGFGFVSHALNNKGQPDIEARRAIEREWAEFCQAGVCCARDRLSMVDMDNLAVDQLCRDGEILMIEFAGVDEGPYGIKFDFIDPEQLEVSKIEQYGRNKVVMGIELDARKRVVAYHVRSSDEASGWPWVYSHGGREYQRIPADRILHIFVTEYVDQLRGFPHTVAAILPLRMMYGYQEGELVAARAAANKLGFIMPGEEDEGFEGDNMFVDEETEDGDEEDVSVIEDTVEFEGDPGSMNYLGRGADIKSFDPQHPNSAYAAFIKTVLRSVSSGLNTGYSGIANDLEGANFGSLRIGAITDRDHWTGLQNFLIRNLKRQQTMRWLRRALLMGAIKRPNGKALEAEKFQVLQGHEHIGRRWQWVDPLKDAQRGRTLMEDQVASPQEIIRERGRNPETVLEEIAQWQQQIKDLGISPTLQKTPVIIQEPPAKDDEPEDDDDATADTSN